MRAAESRGLEGMRHDVDVKGGAVDGIDCQADAVHRHRAFLRNVTGQ